MKKNNGKYFINKVRNTVISNICMRRVFMTNDGCEYQKEYKTDAVVLHDSLHDENTNICIYNFEDIYGRFQFESSIMSGCSMREFLSFDEKLTRGYLGNNHYPHLFIIYFDINIQYKPIHGKINFNVEDFKYQLSKLVDDIKSNISDKYLFVCVLRESDLDVDIFKYIDFNVFNFIIFDKYNFTPNPPPPQYSVFFDFLYDNYYYYTINNIKTKEDIPVKKFIDSINNVGFFPFPDNLLYMWFKRTYNREHVKNIHEFLLDILE